jgi:hypothetical protein
MAPEITVTVLYLCATLSISAGVLIMPRGLSSSSGGHHLAEVAAIASPFVFLCACVLMFFSPRLGYYLGLAAGMLAASWFVWIELLFSEGTNSWIALNLAEPNVEEVAFLTFTKLKVLSVGPVVIAIVCSALRLLPAHVLVRNYPLRLRTWPALMTSFLVLAAWFIHSAIPYRTPRFVCGGAPSVLRILHVVKRGVRFHETEVSVSRDGKAWVWENDRRWFQYRFEARIGLVSLAAASLPSLQRARTLVTWPILSLRTRSPKPLRSWNAEGWYICFGSA